MRIRTVRELVARVGAILTVAGMAAGSWPSPAWAAEGPSTASGAAPQGTSADSIPGVTVLMTRQWSSDGKNPTGTIWRGFQTWRTDVARTEKGDLVPVDPLTPRAGRTEKGELVRFNCNQPTWALLQKFASLEVCRARRVHGSAFPPAGWQAADFDDQTWIRDPYPQRELYGLTALRCLRGKFGVSDPRQVSGLALTVRFRGGAVVYLNGKEVGRAFMPEGEILPETLAEDYPKEAYVAPDGVLVEQGVFWRGKDAPQDRKLFQALRTDVGRVIWGGDWQWHSTAVDHACPLNFVSKHPEVVARYKSRCRTLAVKIPSGVLRKGTNVLAIEIHRAPAWEGMFTSPCYYDGKKAVLSVNWAESWWDRAELEDVKLTAAAAAAAIAANVAPPPGMRVWNHPADVDVDPSYYADPHDPLRPVRLHGLRNGTYSGEIVVSSKDPIRGLNVAVTDLKGPRGMGIPASAIRIGYARVSDGFQGNNTKAPGNWAMFDTLEPSPPQEIASTPWSFERSFPPMQPVWLSVRVPRNVRKGDYRGTVSVSVAGQKLVTTPLEIEVVGEWALPDPQAFQTYVGFLECPDAVAAHYKVPLWSEEHWRLLDKTFEVLGQVGTKDLFIPLVAKTHLGNPCSMVRWIKQADGTYKCDTRIAEQYLDTALRHLGKIPVVCLYVSTRSQYGFNTPLDQPLCTEMNPATGELQELVPPKWGTPGSRAFWKPVIDAMRAILAKRGLEKSMMFGYLADGVGPVAPDNASGMPNHFADLWAISPGTRWMVSTHIAPVSWRTGTLRNEDFLGGLSWMCATLLGTKWMDDTDDATWKPAYGWRDRSHSFLMLAASRSRSPTLDNDHCANLSRLRVAAEGVLLSRTGGQVYQGFGSWGADFWGNQWRAYDAYGNVALSETTSLWMVGPGEAGPVPTCRIRMLQEGLQEAEARIFVQNAILDAGPRAKLGPDLVKRCQDACDERTRAFTHMSNYRYNDGEGSMPRLRLIPDVAAWDEHAVELYRLADEVAGALAKQ
jgi:hypothetical protein